MSRFPTLLIEYEIALDLTLCMNFRKLSKSDVNEARSCDISRLNSEILTLQRVAHVDGLSNCAYRRSRDLNLGSVRGGEFLSRKMGERTFALNSLVSSPEAHGPDFGS